MPSDYRLNPRVSARLLGFSLVLWGLLVFAATAIVVLFAAPAWVLTVAVVACLAGVFTTGFVLTRTSYVVRLTEDGYRVRFVRGVGTDRGRWSEVEDAVTDTIAGSPCVVLKRRDGTRTTIPVEMLAVDREQFVRDLQQHLGNRPPR